MGEQIDQEPFDYEPWDDEGDGEEFEQWPGEECGRWRNGKLVSVYYCLQAGTEFCDWDCPLRDFDQNA